MRKFLIAAILGISLYGRADAASDVNLVISSATYTGIVVSTGTPRRIDNFVMGSTVTTLSNRIGIEIQNLDSTYSIWCAYNAQVTTTTATTAQGNRVGKKIASDDVVYIGLLRQAAYHCQADDSAGAAGVWIHAENLYKE